MRLFKPSLVIIFSIFTLLLNAASPYFYSSPVTSVDQGSTYTYNIVTIDPDGDAMYINVITALPSWLSFTDHGSGIATLTGTPDNDDVGSYSITLSVTAIDGSSTQPFSITVNDINDPPVASGVNISAFSNTIGQTHTGNYTFTDIDGDTEGASVYAWFRGGSTISGATNKTYVTTYDDGGQNITFRVTPVDEHGLAGTAVTSSAVYINDAPVVYNLQIDGVLAQGQTVNANFTYADAENNPAGTHTIQWYRANNSSGGGSSLVGTGTSYTVTSADNNKWISYTVLPVATAGSTPGQLTQSAWFEVTDLPTATISGNVTICDDGSDGDLTITLTGDSPWEVVYSVGGSPSTISNITSSPYTLSSSVAGTYTIVSVEDDNGLTNTGSGTGTISYYTTPTASMDGGNVAVCSGSTASIPVTLTGTGPWSLTYTYNSSPTTVNSIASSPYNIEVSEASTGTYTVTAVSDANCDGTVSGTVEVSVKSTPTATISGDNEVCPGEESQITVNLVGTSPWTIQYSRDGGSAVTIAGITESTHNFNVTTAGEYQLVSVTDNSVNGEGCVSGSATITNFEVPTATASGTVEFCQYTTTTVPVTLTGSPRFTIVYKLGSASNDTIRNITSSPFYIPGIKPSASTSLSLIAVSDLNCPGTAGGTVTLTQKNAPIATISGLSEVYSSTESQVAFTYNPIGGTFDDTELPPTIYLDYGNGNGLFFPSASGSEDSPHILKYRVQGGNGCWGRDSVIISVLESFGQIDVLNEKEVYCFNDPLITLIGANIEMNIGSFSIEGGTGLVDNGDNTATVDPSVIRTGSKIVTYNFTVGGSPETATLDLDFEEIFSDFSWDNECFNAGSAINFEGLGTGDSDLETFIWDIYLPDTTMTQEGENTTFSFDAVGSYQVDYIVESENGCRDTASKTYAMQQTIVIDDDAYFETFESGNGLWTAKRLGTSGPNSWTLGTPDNSVMSADAGVDAWYTDIQNRSLVESSFVISPCFSFTNLDRPMIKMDMWRAFEQRRDGAVLQYSLNDGEGWKNIGQLDDGIEWYNEYQITGYPGGQAIGWSLIKDNDWKETRHDLNILADESSVRLRIAYGSDGTAIGNEGFAFDNVWIGNRKKRVLFEHFTNSGDTVSENANEVVNDVVNSMPQDVLDIQYHTAFPDGDPFYNQNPGISNSREIYYSFDEIPYGFIDGGRGNQSAYMFDYDDQTLTELDVKLAVLEDNLFDIDVKAANADGAVVIETEITATDTISERIITLHHVVLERLIQEEIEGNGNENFESVAKDMVPNTFGVDYERMWYPGESETFSYIWNHLNVYDEDELRVVAFIQDETKTVYQAGISYLDDNILDIEENQADDLHKFTIYPNPSGGKVWIEFNEIVNEDILIQVYDNNSRLIHTQETDGLYSSTELTLNDIKPGVYFVRISTGKKIFALEKLIIARTN